MRPLKLKYAPTPEHAIDFARDIVVAAREHDGIELDYSAESLEHVDRLVGGFRTDGLTDDDLAETLWSFGCYVGEVLRLELQGSWVTPAETPRPDLFRFPLVMAIGKSWWNPIEKVFKRLQNGDEDSLVHFLRVVRQRTSAP